MKQTEVYTGKNHTPSPLALSLTDSGAHLQKGDQEQIGYFLLQIKPSKTANVKSRSPLNLAVVIDRSTSMKGERLQKVKSAAGMLLEKLSPTDLLSVVSYSDRAEVVIPAGPVQDKAHLIAQISSMQAAGGTEILQGLVAGLREISKAPKGEYINQIILLTDGHTYGDDRECIKLAKKAAKIGVGISAFGLGSEWNDFFLDKLVSPSGGQSGYIQEPEQVIHLLRQRISGLGALFAQNMRLDVAFPRVVEVRDMYKVTPFTQPVEWEDDTIHLGTIEGRAPLSVLMELQFNRIDADELTIPYTLRADLPSETPSNVVLSDKYRLKIGRPEKKLPRKLMEAVRLLNLTRMNDRAWEEAQAGDVTAATKRMNYLTKRLEEAGMNDLAQTAMSQTIQLSEEGTIGKTGRIAIKYGTRAKLTQNLSQMLRSGAGADLLNGSAGLNDLLDENEEDVS